VQYVLLTVTEKSGFFTPPITDGKQSNHIQTEQPHLSATVQAWQLSLFSHIARVPDESDAKQILTASPLENWKRPPGRPSTTWLMPTSKTWNH